MRPDTSAPTDPATHLVLIPSFNSGTRLVHTVGAALRRWPHVWVVIDGSTDDSADVLGRAFNGAPGFRMEVLQRNSGKGAAVRHGMKAALDEGFTHALVMDSDGQHSADSIGEFMRASHADPAAVILGVPVFGSDAPRERVQGRRVGNWWANLATLWAGIDDSLFGFRIYPMRESMAVLDSIRSARRFDFDTQIAVRLVWAGVRPINLATPVYYPSRAQGGVTHFRYLRDNLLLFRTHTRLAFGMLVRIPKLLAFKRRWKEIR